MCVCGYNYGRVRDMGYARTYGRPSLIYHRALKGLENGGLLICCFFILKGCGCGFFFAGFVIWRAGIVREVSGGEV